MYEYLLPTTDQASQLLRSSLLPTSTDGRYDETLRLSTAVPGTIAAVNYRVLRGGEDGKEMPPGRYTTLHVFSGSEHIQR